MNKLKLRHSLNFINNQNIFYLVRRLVNEFYYSSYFSKYKELREHEQYEEEDDEEFNQFTRALANAFNSAQEVESPEDQEGEGEGDDTNYKYMLMAMANHLLSEEMEREELDAAIKMSMNPN